MVTTVPVQKSDFGYGEHLLVWSWRRLAAGRADCAWAEQEFTDACGEDGPEVFLTFTVFLKALAFSSRRRLAVGTPGCLHLTADERQVLALLAAAQAGSPARLEAHLRWIAEAERRPVLEIAAGALAMALTANGLLLRLAGQEAATACERDRAVA